MQSDRQCVRVYVSSLVVDAMQYNVKVEIGD